MAIPLSDFANPRFIRYEEGATLSRDDDARYMTFDNTRAYRDGQPQPGYNADNPSLTPERVDLSTDEVNLRPLMSASRV